MASNNSVRICLSEIISRTFDPVIIKKREREKRNTLSCRFNLVKVIERKRISPKSVEQGNFDVGTNIIDQKCPLKVEILDEYSR